MYMPAKPAPDDDRVATKLRGSGQGGPRVEIHRHSVSFQTRIDQAGAFRIASGETRHAPSAALAAL
jgi:hypothetical protein